VKDMTLLERALGRVAGRLYVWLWQLAKRRGDFHEANHCMAAIIASNSSHKHGRWPCPLPESAHARPEIYRAAFTVGDPR
jgi:hypothetical protein